MGNWDRYGHHNVDSTITVRVCDKFKYLFHPAGHYELVGSTVKVSKIFAMTAQNLMPTK